MMICDADFNELFATPSRPERPDWNAAKPGSPSPASLTRWENEGGRPGGDPRPQSGLPDRPRDAVHDPIRATLALAMIPVLVTNEASRLFLKCMPE
jgi:hypothetical protein